MHAPRRPLLLGLALGLAFASAAAPARAATRTSTRSPWPGITLEEWDAPEASSKVHVVIVDLTSSELTVRATGEELGGETTIMAAAAHGAQVAIDGDYFAPATGAPDGLAMSGGVVWTGTHDDARSALFRFGKVQGRTDGLLVPAESVTELGDLAPFTTEIVSGRPQVVRAGAVPASFDCADTGVDACVRAPRSALGLSDDNRLLWLVAVDGWQQGSAGMTAAEVGRFLRDRGVRDAMLLDGGGASTLVATTTGGPLLNHPSDGVARPLANHLTVKFGDLPQGTLIGKVREGTLDGTPLAGVRVVLDDGRSVVTDANDTGYSFAVDPRWACVTATRADLDPVHQCRQVASGELTFNSLIMHPAGTSPDAGVPDAGEPDAAEGDDDAGPGHDDASSDDAGGPGAAEGAGGCCSTGGRRADPATNLGALALFAIGWRRSRRRSRRR
ncbi:MAG TPA: phosphodiester glycosidase family protein [Kofleriaceae bacterium]|nr:phosphodiester glycosidase family protein [Kofleriaceae bacterium]